jgi:hypothetical protein
VIKIKVLTLGILCLTLMMMILTGLAEFPPEDVNEDGKVDMEDIAIVCCAYGSYPGHPRWNPDADINEDLKVDMEDISLVCKQFG